MLPGLAFYQARPNLLTYRDGQLYFSETDEFTLDYANRGRPRFRRGLC